MRLFLAGASLVLAAGLGLTLYGFLSPSYVQPPTPGHHRNGQLTRQPSPLTALAASAARTNQPPTTPSAGSRPAKPPSVPSSPVKIVIPSLGISSNLGPARGLNPDGTVNDAPLSGPTWSLPWWYDRGPTPGQDGSAVLLGHVDSALGAGHLGVFFRLGDLQRGQEITVTLADGTVTRWTVVSALLYSDGQFPDAVVYGRSGPPVLRLVTCGGSFNSRTHHYESATVITARAATS